MISVLEIIQQTYKIPSLLLMMLSIYILIKEIKNKNANFNTSFFIIIVCKLSNEIIFNVNILILYKLPKWGFYNNFLENNDWTAILFYILATQQTTFMFLITLLISINRFVAVKHPLSYNFYFSKLRIITLISFLVILSTIIGLGNILLNARYEKFGLFSYFAPLLKSKNQFYYQLFYQIFLFGVISIATCTFNVMAILALKKNKIISNKYKKELYYIIYSIFIFITLFSVEIFFVCFIIAVKYKITFFTKTNNFLFIVTFDLTSIGDFYYLIYLCNELRNALKTFFGLSKKFKKKVNIKISLRR